MHTCNVQTAESIGLTLLLPSSLSEGCVYFCHLRCVLCGKITFLSLCVIFFFERLKKKKLRFEMLKKYFLKKIFFYQLSPFLTLYVCCVVERLKMFCIFYLGEGCVYFCHLCNYIILYYKQVNTKCLHTLCSVLSKITE